MDPRILLLIVFIGFPFLEIYILLEVGNMIGSIPTIFIIVFTMVLGVLLMRHQGTYNLSRIKKSMDKGEIPAIAMFESVFIFFSAILLLIPGFITDSIGMLFLITPVRRLLLRKIMGLSRFQPPGPGPGPGASGGPPVDSSSARIIEGECKREDE